MDFLETKGLEYLLVLAYLALLLPFWRMLRGSGTRRAEPIPAPVPARESPWFDVPDGFHFHRGHTWAREETGDLVRVGMDDFAHVLLGPIDRLELPAPGSPMVAGQEGWEVEVDGERLPVLSPVSGAVEAVNIDAAGALGSARGDPYGSGWLLKIRVPSARSALKNLMPDRVARAWMDGESRTLNGSPHGELGLLSQDGGIPVFGLARELTGDGWREMARKALLVD